MKRHASSGFTLAELLIALAIGALILGGISATVSAVTRVERQASERALEDRAAKVLLNRLTRELSSAMRGMDTMTLAATDHEQKDELEIQTLAYDTPRLVRYAWKNGEFFRSELDPTFVDEASPILIRGITEANFSFHDGTAWNAQWTAPDLPRAVAIRILCNGRVFGTIVTP